MSRQAHEYTPTTEEVRDRYWIYDVEPADVAEAAFDRWLAAHDREVAAKAIEEAGC